MIIDVAGVNARQRDPDCTFTPDCRNAAIGISMGAQVDISFTSIAVEILLKEYVPLTLENSSNGASHYACYIAA